MFVNEKKKRKDGSDTKKKLRKPTRKHYDEQIAAEVFSKGPLVLLCFSLCFYQ